MQCYTELTPPTAVTHCLTLPFLTATANNLVVVKSSLLQVFAVKSVVSVAPKIEKALNGISPVEAARPERINTSKLVLLAEFPLAGEVTAVARIKILKSKSGGEALLVALRDAKLSLIEWDPERHAVSTISLHYYERDDILSNAFEPDISRCESLLTIDPSSRCAVFKFGFRHIAIVPFHQVGDDVAMDDLGPEGEEDNARKASLVNIDPSNADTSATKAPFAPSFVLSLLALDPSLRHPVHLAFLYEYREPTFGVLSIQSNQSASANGERKTSANYAVYNLDLDQRASTALLSVGNLSPSLFEVLPLSKAIGGALLLGANELIHVDQSGKTNGIAVNVAGKETATIALNDQSDLGLELEGCVIRQLGIDSLDLLLITASGTVCILAFKIDGRSISSLRLHRRDQDQTIGAVGPTCASMVGRGRLFVGCQDSNSCLLGWSRNNDRLKRQRSRNSLAAAAGEGLADEDMDVDVDVDEDEDDLYADESKPEKNNRTISIAQSQSVDEDYQLRVHDTLMNLAPLSDFAFGQVSSAKSSIETHNHSHHQELVCPTGKGKAAHLTALTREVYFETLKEYDLPGRDRLWSASLQADDVRTVLFATSSSNPAVTELYDIEDDRLKKARQGDFTPDAGRTIDVCTLNDSKLVMHILPTEIRAYDSDFGLAQIQPVSEDESDASPCILNASCADPYLLLMKDDRSITIITADEKGDLEELTQSSTVQESQWIAGCLYDDSEDHFRLEFRDDDEGASNVLLFLISTSGGLHIYRLPTLEQPVYVASGLGLVPPFLSPDFTARRSAVREAFREIFVADIGDGTAKTPYLILRNEDRDIIVYQPYQAAPEGAQEPQLHLLKIQTGHHAPPLEYDTDSDEHGLFSRSLRPVHGPNDTSHVWVSGPPSFMLMKSASSPLRALPIARHYGERVESVSTSWCMDGVLTLNEKGTITLSRLPSERDISTGWMAQRLPFDAEVNVLAYHSHQQIYALGALRRVDFKLPPDEQLRSPPPEHEPFLPHIEESTIQLYDRNTCTIIDSHALDTYELATCLETVSLEVSETTHERQEMICVGTAMMRGEDLAAVGFVYVFAVNDVVPDPDQPGSGRALKLICKEEVRGAVTGLSGVGTQGFLLIAQGQKCLVRGLKEDGSLLPVAFIDVQTHVTVVSELPGTGLCIIGDAIKGIWFCGYTEEPYQLRMFGKTPYHIETIAATLLPDGKNLFFVVADADGNLHMFQFDPENPQSLAGRVLVPASSPFHTSCYPRNLKFIPPAPVNSKSTKHHGHHEPMLSGGSVLLTSLDGSLSIITAVPTSTHRLLASLQTHLNSNLSHPLGLNPKAFRTPSATSKAGVAGGAGSAEMAMIGAGFGRGIGGSFGTGVLDGNVLKRWAEPGSWRRWGVGEDMREVRLSIGKAVGDPGF